MKYAILAFFVLFSSVATKSQSTGCISGSCTDGFGKYIYTNGYVFEGNFVDSLRVGLGKLNTPAGDSYDGMWAKDQFNGQGTYKWADGSKYTGEWKNGVQDGYGIFFYPNGDKYTGYFRNNKFQGEGKYTWADGSTQEGLYENGSYKGKI